MKVTFLGTGTSQGVPVISCPCAVCHSSDEKDKRLRSSVWIETERTSIVIDTGPDFRQQMLVHHVNKLDAVLFTHSHKDHISGLDDIRAYNYFQGKSMDVYATTETQEALRKEYSYIFENADYPGVPQVTLHTIDGDTPFSVGDVEVVPIRVWHYKMEVLGFRIGDFTYITDANRIDNDQLGKIHGSKCLVLNALRVEKHISHFALEEALVLAETVGADHTYFTHISHQLGLHKEVEADLPLNVHLAYDGLEIII